MIQRAPLCQLNKGLLQALYNSGKYPVCCILVGWKAVIDKQSWAVKGIGKIIGCIKKRVVY